jgi:hypothetical protein
MFLVVDNVVMSPEKEPEALNLIGVPLCKINYKLDQSKI